MTGTKFIVYSDGFDKIIREVYGINDVEFQSKKSEEYD
jgi:hypothetical protein